MTDVLSLTKVSSRYLRLCGGSMFLLLATVRISAQIAGAPAFEVASVKRCDARESGTNGGTIMRGRVEYACLTVTTYIRQAYGYTANQKPESDAGLIAIEGQPRWADTELYQISAKADGPAGGAMLGLMMQTLLQDRFRLKLHKETRSVPAYRLVVSKSGLRVPTSKGGCFTPGSGRPPMRPGEAPPPMCGQGRRNRDGIIVYGATMGEFCAVISRRLALRLDRVVVDGTALTGKFDFDIRWPSDGSSAPSVQDNEGTAHHVQIDDVARLQDGLYRLGLQLVSGKGSGEFLVIDHVERPTAN